MYGTLMLSIAMEPNNLIIIKIHMNFKKYKKWPKNSIDFINNFPILNVKYPQTFYDFRNN